MRLARPIPLLLLVIGLAPAVAPAASGDPDRVAVKAVVDDWVQVFENHDMALFTQIVAHDPDMVNFGTDPEEHFVGWNALNEFIGKALQSVQDAKLAVSEQVITLRPAAHLAWVTELVVWDYVYHGKPVHQNCRFSGVLEKRKGRWVFVQFHNSVPSGA